MIPARAELINCGSSQTSSSKHGTLLLHVEDMSKMLRMQTLFIMRYYASLVVEVWIFLLSIPHTAVGTPPRLRMALSFIPNVRYRASSDWCSGNLLHKHDMHNQVENRRCHLPVILQSNLSRLRAHFATEEQWKQKVKHYSPQIPNR